MPYGTFSFGYGLPEEELLSFESSFGPVPWDSRHSSKTFDISTLV